MKNVLRDGKYLVDYIARFNEEDLFSMDLKQDIPDIALTSAQSFLKKRFLKKPLATFTGDFHEAEGYIH